MYAYIFAVCCGDTPFTSLYEVTCLYSHYSWTLEVWIFITIDWEIRTIKLMFTALQGIPMSEKATFSVIFLFPAHVGVLKCKEHQTDFSDHRFSTGENPKLRNSRITAIKSQNSAQKCERNSSAAEIKHVNVHSELSEKVTRASMLVLVDISNCNICWTKVAERRSGNCICANSQLVFSEALSMLVWDVS